MYAVVFDLDTNCLGECYDGQTYHGAYKLVRDYLTANGFSHTQVCHHYSEIGQEISLVFYLRQRCSNAPH